MKIKLGVTREMANFYSQVILFNEWLSILL